MYSMYFSPVLLRVWESGPVLQRLMFLFYTPYTKVKWSHSNIWALQIIMPLHASRQVTISPTETWLCCDCCSESDSLTLIWCVSISHHSIVHRTHVTSVTCSELLGSCSSDSSDTAQQTDSCLSKDWDALCHEEKPLEHPSGEGLTSYTT